MTIVPVKRGVTGSPRGCVPMPGRRTGGRPDGAGPLVSVMLPASDRRGCVAQTLASVRRQTYENLEIFVVTDGGERVCDVVRSVRDPRVAFIDHNGSRGKRSSLNEALARARGKYVAYLEGDHVYCPGHVGTLVAALEGPTDCQAAYSDAYETCWDVTPRGDRRVLSKRVEVSRDFDRFLMLYCNHVPHACLMHRRDLLDRTGLFNERLGVLGDWDMARRLSFYTDFYHVPAVTSECHRPACRPARIEESEDSQEILRSTQVIRSTRPPKPWPKMKDLSVILLADEMDGDAADLILRIWRHTFYPYKLLIPLPPGDIRRLNLHMPNVELVVMNSLSSAAERVDVALRRCEGEYVAIVPVDAAVREMWVERPLYAMMTSTAREGFLLEGATSPSCGAVLRRADLERARETHVGLSVEASLAATGIALRHPRAEESPFQSDHLLRQAELAEADGDWTAVGRLLERLEESLGGRLWISEMAARAHFQAGNYRRAGQLSGRVNTERPTVDTLLLEAKVHRRTQRFGDAIRLLTQAERILGSEQCASAVAPCGNCLT